MIFTDLPLTQEYKTLGTNNYLWVQALFNHEELERLCQGYSLQLTGTRGLVEEGGVEGMFEAFRS